MNKEELRKKIAITKQKYSEEELYNMSEEVFSVLQITGVFSKASNICIYNAMPGEVYTQPFIEQWISEKNFYLPVIVKDEIVLRKIDNKTQYTKSQMGILEPVGDNFSDYSKLDLIIVPGVAFDRRSNRLGRGKGYYDRFLSKIKAPKIGVCFDFQLFDQIPTNEWDIKMDMVASENDLIW